jgi:O-antigen ligase
MEGNAVDQVVYSALILAGGCVLVSRRVQLRQIMKNNLAIVLFLLYAVVSVLWSDYPLTGLKRWVKALGDPVMVLVIWTDPNPVRAVTATIKRCAYVLIPLSLLFCKYYEYLGRAVDPWGKVSYTGVTTDKNMFGYLLFSFGLFFVAAFMSNRDPQRKEPGGKRTEQLINVLLLAMIGWLLPIANSKTATVALAAGVAIILALRFATVRKHFWVFAVVAVLLATVGDQLFSVKSAILEASGRDATFTGRTGLWETVLKEPINPLFGVGYATFWLGERLARFWAMYPNSPPIQAHNGYIEVYLNLGLIGVCLLAAVLWRGLRTIQARATAAFAPLASSTYAERTLALWGMAFGVAYLMYNVTEATFQGLNFLFTLFLILAFNSVKTSTAPNKARAGSQATLWKKIEQRPAMRARYFR